MPQFSTVLIFKCPSHYSRVRNIFRRTKTSSMEHAEASFEYVPVAKKWRFQNILLHGQTDNNYTMNLSNANISMPLNGIWSPYRRGLYAMIDGLFINSLPEMVDVVPTCSNYKTVDPSLGQKRSWLDNLECNHFLKMNLLQDEPFINWTCSNQTS